MTVAAPLFLLGGLVAAAALVALHFLARREPTRWLLPTARFVPDTKERAPARSVRLNDRLLLLARLFAVLTTALAFARPSFTAMRPPLLRVILADTSRSVADTGNVRRRVRALRGDAGVIVPVGSAGLSAALIRGIREARARRDQADSLALVVVSPLAREEVDAATIAIRATWPGAVVWDSVAAAGVPAELSVTFRGSEADPLRAGLALAGIPVTDTARVRLIRSSILTGSDSAWALAGDRVLVQWPDAAPAAGADTVGAVVTPSTVLVARFTGGSEPAPGTPVAWWVGGRAAASELPWGRGCLRSVAVPVPTAGDLVLTPRFRALVRDLLGPCGGARDLGVADSATRAALRGTGPAAVPAGSLPPGPETGRSAMPWLLALSLLALVGEQALRRRVAR